ncbi:HNH endonuclease [Phycicoccus sp. HDW14]|uniref:HNH endonuclease signature motif containing protein n=1 Tax=Phycicoccus sp. HDW14 TaxID=2714941 RepID=UPI00140BC288|nr:HNH endonuclease signature motif containing protein [Phycicoccus sp. HDW14]QIM21434.1 HNH endonuclease [Phycicoccus sp. HDW14]
MAARFCDLDHVRPWPLGPTAATNLLCLCRRHHRLKQSPGWRLRLAPDGTATWTDPTGRLRTTAALDALESVVLPAADAARFPPRGPEPPPPWSALESRLTVLAEHARPCRLEVHGREHHGRRHRSRWPERPPF